MKRLFALLAAALFMIGCADGKTQRDDRIIIALVDTGVSTAAIDSEKLLSGYNYITDSTDTEDRVNHGTAVASIIAGCESAEVDAEADFAYIVPLVIADKIDGEVITADADTLARAIRDAVDVYGADIVNLSLGVQNDSDELRNAVDYASENGVLLVSAVGNNGDDGVSYYPASYDSVIAVGSCDKDGKKSYFSQSGADVLAQGEGMLLASRNGAQYGIKGTSFATGHVSAYAAKLIYDNPDMSAAELLEETVKAAEANGGCIPQD